MTVYIDQPLWPAHGTLWSHLVTDTHLDELHEFAARLGAPRRGFDLDHYDIPASLYARAVSLGAHAVDAREVVHLLHTSGLRVRASDRDAARPVYRRQYLVSEWEKLGAASQVPADRWRATGDDIIARWNEPHRTYHDERHLEDVLLSLNQLHTRGEQIDAATLLAAWFHDAVYEGRLGHDEADSAALAVRVLADLGFTPGLVERVGDLIIATTPEIEVASAGATAGLAAGADQPLAHLLDADLAIFASGDSRYAQYSAAVRLEYAHVPDPEFRLGRARILSTYLEQPTIYRTDAARTLWEDRARLNLAREITGLTR